MPQPMRRSNVMSRTFKKIKLMRAQKHHPERKYRTAASRSKR